MICGWCVPGGPVANHIRVGLDSIGELGGSCADGAVFKISFELAGVAGGRKAGLAGADDGLRFVEWQMRKGFFEGPGESGELRAGRDAQYGFANAEDAMGGFFESLGNMIIGIARDHHLNGMTSKQRGGEAVGGSEKAVLGSGTGEGFERFLGKCVVAIVAGKRVHSN